VPTTVEQVIEGFGPEGRLNGFTIRAQILDGVPSLCLDQHEVLSGVSGAVLATLPLIEQAEQPTVVIRMAAGASSVMVDITQSVTSISPGLARRFFDKTADDRPGGWCAVAGALAAKSLADRHGGQATFESGPNGGGGLRIVFPRR
jgi:hypothetical protein